MKPPAGLFLGQFPDGREPAVARLCSGHPLLGPAELRGERLKRDMEIDGFVEDMEL